MNIVASFENKEVRFVGSADAPEWVAADIGRILDIQNIRQNLAEFDDEEKGVCTIYTPGDKNPEGQRMLTVKEPGLYRLIFQSRKPEAKRLQKWVFSEVLPCIRKHGCYPAPLYADKNPSLLELNEILELPSVELGDKKSLPKAPGIYFVVIKSGVNDSQEIFYIGSSENLRARWQGHHLAALLGKFVQYGIKVSIHWLLDISLRLRIIESNLITKHLPFSNQQSCTNSKVRIADVKTVISAIRKNKIEGARLLEIVSKSSPELYGIVCETLELPGNFLQEYLGFTYKGFYHKIEIEEIDLALCIPKIVEMLGTKDPQEWFTASYFAPRLPGKPNTIKVRKMFLYLRSIGVAEVSEEGKHLRIRLV